MFKRNHVKQECPCHKTCLSQKLSVKMWAKSIKRGAFRIASLIMSSAGHYNIFNTQRIGLVGACNAQSHECDRFPQDNQMVTYQVILNSIRACRRYALDKTGCTR